MIPICGASLVWNILFKTLFWFQAHSPLDSGVAGAIKQEPQECEISVGGVHLDQLPLKKIKQEVSLGLCRLLHLNTSQCDIQIARMEELLV